MASLTDPQLENLNRAWHQLVEKGVISKKALRPVVARSWQRSRTHVNPLNVKLCSINDSILNQKCSENAALISSSRPIIENISKLPGKKYVSLCDCEGYILDIVGDTEYIPHPGVRCSEDIIGTNAIGTALIEKTPLEIRGYEHYSPRYHNYCCAAVPISDPGGNTLGVIDVTNPYGELPAGILHVLSIGVNAIEKDIALKLHQTHLATNKNHLLSLFDNIEEPLIIFDGSGLITNVNSKCLDILGISNRKSILGMPVTDFIIDNKFGISPLFDQKNLEISVSGRFLLKSQDTIHSCSLAKNFVMEDMSPRTVLLFSPQKSSKKKALATVDRVSNCGLYTFDDLIGHSPLLIATKKMAEKAAHVNSSILIEGESGTGKELLAQSIHCESGRKGKFVSINCGAITKELLQSELFGYEEGAFTGSRRGGAAGKFEIADGGTVFLDEIGEMPLDMQVSLLRFLQDKTVTRLGGNKPTQVDVRIIAATNRTLKEEVCNGNFREDLYYRLNVINLKLPPLRERKEDIPLITNYLVEKLSHQLNRQIDGISNDAINLLQQYNWPGNVRELSNIIENAVVFSEGKIIKSDVLPEWLIKHEYTTDELQNYERKVIVRTLEKYNGNITKAAQDLGIARNTLYRKISRMGINLT